MIIFVGDEPSEHNIDPQVAFVGTKSYKTLLDWIYKMNLSVTELCLYNRTCPDVTYWKDQQDKGYRSIVFIALGRKAEIQLTKNGIRSFFTLPHPSGKNFKLNDKEWLDEQLDNCVEYIKQHRKHYKDRE